MQLQMCFSLKFCWIALLSPLYSSASSLSTLLYSTDEFLSWVRCDVAVKSSLMQWPHTPPPLLVRVPVRVAVRRREHHRSAWRQPFLSAAKTEGRALRAELIGRRQRETPTPAPTADAVVSERRPLALSLSLINPINCCSSFSLIYEYTFGSLFASDSGAKATVYPPVSLLYPILADSRSLDSPSLLFSSPVLFSTPLHSHIADNFNLSMCS